MEQHLHLSQEERNILELKKRPGRLEETEGGKGERRTL
jgi:hypothetical protein